MVSLFLPLSRRNHVVFVLRMVCLATSLASTIFVFARVNEGELSATVTAASALTISGQVTDNTIGLPGVTMTLSGSQSGVTLTDSNGFYSFEVAAGGNYTVIPSATGLAFDPSNLTVIDLSTSRIGNFVVSARTFVVTNTNDHGAGSFREAITKANGAPGIDSIPFNIPAPGVKVISLLTPLPEITDPVVISANAQPGYAGSPLIELDGTNAGAGANGLVITAGGSIVDGLSIGGFQAAGIVLQSGNGTGLGANYIGVDATGTVARPNNIGIQLINSSNNLIGGTVRNVISGNLSYGVQGSGSNNRVWGNFIGTNAAGTAAIAEIPGNSLGFIGVSLSGPNCLIGGTSAGMGNLISGNRIGIDSGNTIQGNLIGTDITGTRKVPNFIGIFALGGTTTVIGGLTPGARNVISGNGFAGVEISGNGSKLQGNFVGTDITGTVALGNGKGVVSGNGGSIGGTVPEARNVIAGNGENVVLDLGPAVLVQNNYIGTDVTGTRALGGKGILILSDHHSITHNVVSGNSIGILAGQPFLIPGQGNSNIIQDNLIGLNAQGTGPLPNASDGINLQAGSSNNTVVGNKIAFNEGAGVTTFGGTNNSIRGNSIFSNGELGIDLGSNGVTPNDPTDTDDGENNLQNFPVITSVVSVGDSTTIQGSLNSIPNTFFVIDLYSSAALDPSGYGEGARFLSPTGVITDANGDAIINVTLPTALGPGRVVTATATDPNGNTSEFSAGDITSTSGNLQFSVGSIRVIEDVGSLTVTVLRKGGSSGDLTIDYETVAGTATSGEDYTGASGTLTFHASETSKSFQIPILDDDVTEPDETFTVRFKNPPSLEALGTPSSIVVTIQDRATVPIILQNIVSVVEGNAGSSAEALFTFTLSAATGRSVSADYATVDLSARGSSSCATEGTDYETNSGTISFQPGDTSSVTILVKICGDTSAEASEDFRVNLSNLSNAKSDPGHGVATIVDDDNLELLLEEEGSTLNQAAALDAVFGLRDPFRVKMPEYSTIGLDQNTRVMFFVRGLQLDPGELPSAVVVYFGASFQSIGVPAEDVRPVPNVDFVQVVVRLPDSLAENVYTVTVTAHNRPSNSGLIRIAP